MSVGRKYEKVSAKWNTKIENTNKYLISWMLNKGQFRNCKLTVEIKLNYSTKNNNSI